METALFQLTGDSESWMSPSSNFISMDMIFSVICGVWLFLLLIPFLKTYPTSPPPGSGEDTPKVTRRGRSRTRKKIASAKGCRDGRENAEDTQNASQPVKIPSKHTLLDSTPHAFWNPNEKPDQLPLSQLLSSLKFLEDLMQQKFSRIFGGMSSSMLSESVVASAWVSKRPSFEGPKTSSFSNTYGPFPALPMAQGPSQMSQAQPLPHQLVTPSLADVTEPQTLDNLPRSTPSQALSLSKGRAHVKAGSTSETRMQVSLRTKNQPWQQDLERKDTIGSNVQTRQEDISQPSHNFPGDTLLTEAISSASVLSERRQVLQHHEESQSKCRGTKVREQPGSPSRLLPAQELTQMQGHSPANGPFQPKDKPDLSQCAQPSIFDSSRMPLKKGPEKHNIHTPTKEGPSFRAKNLTCTSSSSPGKGLEPRNPALRTDQRSYVNTTHDLSFLDPKIQRKLESNITQLPVKHRRRPYLHTIESRDLTAPGVPASSLTQILYPSSPTCVSQSEYCPKAAVILENLHHQDPGGTRVHTLSTSKLQTPVFAHSPSEVQEMQRVTPPAASHGPSKAHPDAWQGYLNTRANAYCLQARTQHNKTIRGTGRGSLQPRTSPRISRSEPGKRFENVASRHPCWSGTMVDPEVRTPSSEQRNRIVAVKKETPSPWKVTPGYSKIPNGQNININLRDIESVKANRNPGQFQAYPQHSRGPALKSQMLSDVDFKSNKQQQSCHAGLLPDRQSAVCPTTDRQSAVCPTTVSLPLQNSLSHFQGRSKHPRTSQGLGDVYMRRGHSQESQELTVPKDKIPAIFPPSEERKDFMRSRTKSQGEKLGRMELSQAWGLNSSTQLKDIVVTESQPSLDVPANEQASVEIFLNKIVRNILQYLNSSTKDKEQGDSLKNGSPPPSTLQTQEAVTKEKLIYNMATEAQSLTDAVAQILAHRLGLNVEDPPKAHWCKVEPLASQIGGSHHSSEGLYDAKKNRPERRISSDPHYSPKGHNHPSTGRGIGDEQQLSVDVQTACDQHRNRVKRGMGFDQVPTRKRSSHPFLYRRTGDKQQSGSATRTACDPDQIKVKSGMGYCPHSSPKEHKHPFLHRETGNKQQAGIEQKACDLHQSTKKGTHYGHLNSLKEHKHPVRYRVTDDKQQSGITALGACD
ncbi:spermatogenesis-associated protein 31-like [Mesocricetus auratus]|uniref:Spermatogenesis-associated protein 31-like n=1 Tax=Mesocricetus auratus TaxID=10036 RepID=A0ABM2YEP7_MESAU|nr:spermatogenesis-associated protein 31-like [Mesocricetus auratus]